MRGDSLRTNSTLGAQRIVDLIQSRCPRVQREPAIVRLQSRLVETSTIERLAARDILIRKRQGDRKFKDSSKGVGHLLGNFRSKKRTADVEIYDFEPHELSRALLEAVQESGNVSVAKALIDMEALMFIRSSK